MTDRELLELAREAGLISSYGGREIASDDLLQRFAALVRNATLEKCAVVAWNHYMDRCKLSGISPTVFEDWCSAAAIREMKEQT